MSNSMMQALALFEMSISCALILIWLLQKLTQQTFPFWPKLILLIIFGNLFFWPLGLSLELPLAAYVRGITGDFSIVTTLLLWSTLLPNHKATPSLLKLGIVMTALGFYPFALGLGMVDPYAWGYGSIVFLIAVLAFALLCGSANWTKGVWIIGMAIIAWSAHWHESSNLWDYLLDPLLVIWAIASLLTAWMQQRQEKARAGYLFRPG